MDRKLLIEELKKMTYLAELTEGEAKCDDDEDCELDEESEYAKAHPDRAAAEKRILALQNKRKGALKPKGSKKTNESDDGDDEELDEKAPPRRRMDPGGRTGPRPNTVYGNNDKLADKEPAPKSLGSGDHGYNNRKKIHQSALKDKLKNGAKSNPGVVYPPEYNESKPSNRKGGFKKLGKNKVSEGSNHKQDKLEKEILELVASHNIKGAFFEEGVLWVKNHSDMEKATNIFDSEIDSGFIDEDDVPKVKIATHRQHKVRESTTIKLSELKALIRESLDEMRLVEGYEQKIISALKRKHITAWFDKGVLYVGDKHDAKKAAEILDDDDDILKSPKIEVDEAYTPRQKQLKKDNNQNNTFKANNDPMKRRAHAVDMDKKGKAPAGGMSNVKLNALARDSYKKPNLPKDKIREVEDEEEKLDEKAPKRKARKIKPKLPKDR